MSTSSSHPPRRRVRKLTDDERHLWDGIARSAKPLRSQRVRVKAEQPGERPAAEDAAAQPALGRAASLAAPTPAIRAAAENKPKLPPLATMPRRIKSRVARGARAIDSRIDLHGMRQDEAFVALRAFLAGAAQRGHALVLVITGKGRSAAPDRERGVLRAKVPQWLASAEFRAVVLGFEEAHIGHGGEGALYVRVRKARKSRATD